MTGLFTETQEKEVMEDLGTLLLWITLPLLSHQRAVSPEEHAFLTRKDPSMDLGACLATKADIATNLLVAAPQKQGKNSIKSIRNDQYRRKPANPWRAKP